MKRAVLGLLLLSAACKRAPAEPEPTRSEATAETTPSAAEPATPATATAQGSDSYAGSTTPAAAAAASTASAVAKEAAPERPVPPGHRKVTAKPVAPVTPSPDDPLGGKFTLEDATKGLPGKGALVAEIKTSLGKLTCELYDDRAPITVANFVGLARGVRPFKNPQGAWTKTPAYDGTTFHRIIRGFMIQGGDPAGTGAGEPGYVIPDEVWDGAYHSERGLICMANRGPNTNGMQFFIMDGSSPHLDSGYTIFGKCGPDAVVEKIASTEVRGERPTTPPKIEKVTIRRDASKKPAGAAPSAAPVTGGTKPPASGAASAKP
jgi:peptidyl-prolyl cis-trans isomerase A (cyclophilin A)